MQTAQSFWSSPGVLLEVRGVCIWRPDEDGMSDEPAPAICIKFPWTRLNGLSKLKNFLVKLECKWKLCVIFYESYTIRKSSAPLRKRLVRSFCCQKFAKNRSNFLARPEGKAKKLLSIPAAKIRGGCKNRTSSMVWIMIMVVTERWRGAGMRVRWARAK